MKLKKSYTFLYMPEDHGPTRQFKVARWGIMGPGIAVAVLLGLATLYGVSVRTGNGWLPGGSKLQQENLALVTTVAGLEDQVVDLREEIDSVYEAGNLMAAAIDLPPLDSETFAAGVGGRGHLDFPISEVPGLDAVGRSAVGTMGEDLEQMLRQARIQRQGFMAMLDTLSDREAVRGRIPSIRPLDTGWISSRFGFRNDPFTTKQKFHRGLDFSTPVGTPVRVTGDGVVQAVQQQRGFGKVVKIDHGDGIVTVYAHLSETLVKKGANVARGDVIARSGNSGRSSAPHLHYEIRVGSRPVNPLSYILDSYATRR
jgi:murein DD-endopeptidase MepM/ murein hydrolase activator NlpD